MRIRIIYGINVANLQKNIQFCLEFNNYFYSNAIVPLLRRDDAKGQWFSPGT